MTQQTTLQMRAQPCWRAGGRAARKQAPQVTALSIRGLPALFGPRAQSKGMNSPRAMTNGNLCRGWRRRCPRLSNWPPLSAQFALHSSRGRYRKTVRRVRRAFRSASGGGQVASDAQTREKWPQ